MSGDCSRRETSTVTSCAGNQPARGEEQHTEAKRQCGDQRKSLLQKKTKQGKDDGEMEEEGITIARSEIAGGGGGGGGGPGRRARV